MAKQHSKQTGIQNMQQANEAVLPAQVPTIAGPERGQDSESQLFGFSLPSFTVQAIFVALLAILFYANTYQNGYALDDTAIIVSNEYVHQGFAGIPDILARDVYYSYYKQLNSSDQLTGGRYRPLSVVSFAVEQQLFGAVPRGETDSVIRYGLGYNTELPYEKKFMHEMHIRHLVNVLLYAILGIVFLYMLRSIVFRSHPVMALIGAVLFIIHPLHTEVVANVKSRDEILSLIFICLTFILSCRYLDQKKIWLLASALGCYFLAYLSKEYALTLLVLLPLAFYLFKGLSVPKSLLRTLPYLAVTAVYILIRLQAIGQRNEMSDSDIQINPYAWASGTEKLATEISTSLRYLKLLLLPHPLSSDYSYNQIPYVDFSSPMVWFSLAVHLGLAGGFFYFLKKQPVLSFAIAFYLGNLLLVNNIFFDIGATLGERLIFHASVGFVIALAFLLVKGAGQLRGVRFRAVSLGAFMLLLIVLCGFKTIDRNKDWKSDSTLFFKDIHVSPNSFLVNVNVATMLVNQSDYEKNDQVRIANLHRGVSLYTRVLHMQDNYVLGYMNRSIAYYKLGMADSMVADLDRVLKLYPIHPVLPEMYYHAGVLYAGNRQYAQADSMMHRSMQLHPGIQEVTTAIRAIEDSVRASK